MYPKNLIFFLITFQFSFIFGYSQNHLESQDSLYILRTASLDSIESNTLKHYSVDKFSNALDLAIVMSQDEGNKNVKKRGSNLIAILAKSFTNQITTKAFNFDDKKVKELIIRFENEKYFIERPKISRFIKLANYLCKGDYVYVHKKLIETSVYRIILIFIIIYISAFILTYSDKFNWKFKKQFRRFTLFSVIILVVTFVLFKTTCHNNIQDYSFYGITI